MIRFPEKKPEKPSKFCEHGVYRSRCPHHRNLYVLGMNEETYQLLLNLKAKYRLKTGKRGLTWAQFFYELILDLAGKDFV
jgi:hypothetical protein